MKLKINIAQFWDVPYKDNGRSLEEGLDCYGFVLFVCRQNGIELPDYSRYVELDEWKDRGFLDYMQHFNNLATEVFDHPRPGDILLIKHAGVGIDHIAIMYNLEEIVHFVVGYGFAKSRYTPWKNKVQSIWRL